MEVNRYFMIEEIKIYNIRKNPQAVVRYYLELSRQLLQKKYWTILYSFKSWKHYMCVFVVLGA